MSQVVAGILERCLLPRDMNGCRRVLLGFDTVSGHVETFVVFCAGKMATIAKALVFL